MSFKDIRRKYFQNLESQGSISADRKLIYDKNGSLKEGSYFIKNSELLKTDFVDKELNICVKSGTLIEAGATIKNHTIVDDYKLPYIFITKNNHPHILSRQSQPKWREPI